MGRSTASCFKIITCGSDAGDKDDVEVPESKSSSDKRGWSFRKRSARHRVLSNTVISEAPSSLSKEFPETATISFQTQPSTTILEKASAVAWTDEKSILSTAVNLKATDTRLGTEDGVTPTVDLDETVIVIIQCAVRGFLAQKELLKLKNVVKLQATVRGYLVRRHAVGTLRCVQAIVKMQALVRARRARISLEKDNGSLMLAEKRNTETRPNESHTSIEKLLNNKFARQLLESTPKTKSIHVKCDPSRSDSAWKWLERWMSVTSSHSQKPESCVEQQDQDRVDHSASQVERGSTFEDCKSTDFKDSREETVVPCESEENLVTCDTEIFNFQAHKPTLASKSDNLVSPQHEVPDPLSSCDNSLDLLPNKQSDSISHMEHNSNSSLPEMESGPSKNSVSGQPLNSVSQMEFNSVSVNPEACDEGSTCSKNSIPEQFQTEGKNLVVGPRKETNRVVIAAQTKFEELSSTANSVRSTNSYKEGVTEPNSDAVSSETGDVVKTVGSSSEEIPISNSPVVQVGGSECGTELSISSTFDSPDRPGIGLMMDAEQETKLLQESSIANGAKNLPIEHDHQPTISGSDLAYSTFVQPEKVDDHGTDSVSAVPAVDSLKEKQKSDTSTSNVQIELNSETGHQALKSSPEASPRSHITVPESQGSQGTPSSQVSINAKKAKTDKSTSNQKRRSLSAGRRSPSNSNHDSGLRSSLEQLPKEHKIGKRRFSLGRTDSANQDSRDSSSNSSLPNYMQATESTRAKALANSSPRSSPDVQEKDIYIKKRHSLPSANGRQESPHTQQSTSQAQHSAKGNGQPHEKVATLKIYDTEN